MNIYDFFVDALKLNENINFTTVLTCLGLYFLFFWFAVSVWVYKDAGRRYSNPKTALTIALGVFVLFFPALILYIAVRKSEYDAEHEFFEEAGVNVPVVNFVGDNGVNMTLELNISPKSENTLPSDMKVNVKWDSNNQNMKKIENHDLEEKKDLKQGDKESVMDKFKTIIKKIKAKIIAFKLAQSKKEDQKSNDTVDKKIEIKVEDEKHEKKGEIKFDGVNDSNLEKKHEERSHDSHDNNGEKSSDSNHNNHNHNRNNNNNSY